MIKAACTWGDGPDILVTWEDHRVMLYEDPIDFDKAIHGYVKSGSFDLTFEQAEILANQLLMAAKIAKDLIPSLLSLTPIDDETNR